MLCCVIQLRLKVIILALTFSVVIHFKGNGPCCPYVIGLFTNKCVQLIYDKLQIQYKENYIQIKCIVIYNSV